MPRHFQTLVICLDSFYVSSLTVYAVNGSMKIKEQESWRDLINSSQDQVYLSPSVVGRELTLDESCFVMVAQHN